MTYATMNLMSQDQALLARIAACAAEEGNTNPRSWAASNVLHLVPAWDEAWESAQASLTVNDNPRIGERTDVVTDGMILSAVQARKALQGPGNDGWAV